MNKLIVCFLAIVVLILGITAIEVIIPNDIRTRNGVLYADSIINRNVFNATSSAINLHYFKNQNYLELTFKVCQSESPAPIFVFLKESEMRSTVDHFIKLGFPVFGVSTNSLFGIKNENEEFVFGLPKEKLINLMIQIVPEDAWKETVIYHNSRTDQSFMAEFVKLLTQRNIKSNQVDVSSLSNSQLEYKMVNLIKLKIRFIYIFMDEKESVLNLISLGLKTKIVQQNYFWTILNNDIRPSDILQLLSYKHLPNIILIKPTLIRSVPNSACNSSMCDENIFGFAFRLLEVFQDLATVNISFADGQFQCNGQSSQIMKNKFVSVLNKMEKWKTLQGEKFKIDILASKSVDITPSIPNKFTYVSSFEISQTFDLKYQLPRFSNEQIFVNHFTGWNNKTLYLCSPGLTPSLTYLGNSTLHGLDQISGVIQEVLLVLSKKLNFVPMLYEAEDKFWGVRFGITRNYSGCVGEVFNEKSLFGASVFTINADRQEDIDFSVPFMDESNCASLQYPKPTSKTWHIFRPLHWNTWSTLILAIFLTSLACYIIAVLSPFSAWNLKLRFAIIDEIRLREHVWNVVGSSMQQGQDFYPYAMSCRTILAVWWLFTIIVFSAYTADLTSFLTVKSEGRTIETLEELASRKDIKVVTPGGTITAKLLRDSPYPVYQEINKRISYISTIDECPRMILQENASDIACITDTSPTLYVVKRNCSKIYIIPETFNTASMAFTIQKDSAFTPKLNQYLTKMMQDGDIDKWVDKYWSTSDPNIDSCDKTSNQDSAPAVEIEGILGVYICTGVIILLSFFCLMVELIWVHVFKKSVHSLICQS